MKKPTNKQTVKTAKRLFQDDGTLEVDDGAEVSRADGNPEQGAYVQAWVWVPDDAVKGE